MYTFEWKNKSNQMCQLVLKETRSPAQHSLIQFLPPRCHGIPQFMEIEHAHQTPMRVMSSQPAADNQRQTTSSSANATAHRPTKEVAKTDSRKLSLPSDREVILGSAY